MALVLTALACGSPAEVRHQPDPSSERTLPSGKVTGFTGTYGNQAWLGLRYAQPPLGELRFRAPQPLRRVPQTHSALGFGAACPQFAHAFGVREAEPGTPVGQEDCLYLNVFAPRLSAPQAATTRLPVMVWIHGGGNVLGHAGNYDGGRLAQREQVVVVTVNYRLGPLGWFSHAALREQASPEDASGNYGILDLLAALRWVKANIAAFGGSPENVTVFGESAGGRNILNLLQSPLALGLFQRAIVESANVGRQDALLAEIPVSQGGHHNSSSEVLVRLLVADHTASTATAARAALSHMTPAQIAAYLRGKSAYALLAAYSKEPDEALISAPNVFSDGFVLPKDDALAVFGRPNGYRHVPLIIGTNRDENKTFLIYDPRQVRRFTALYMRLRDTPRYNALAEALSRSWKVSGADAIASAIAANGDDVFVYRFDWDEEPTLLGAELSVILGAGHGLEIPFVFGDFDLGREANVIFDEANRAGREFVSQQMMDYWGEFARSGRPGKGRGDQPEWPPFGEPAGSRFVIFDTPAGGGTRLGKGALGMDDVLAGVDRDPRLRNARERCAVFHELVRWSPLLAPGAYLKLGREGCARFPFDRYPWD